MTPQIPKSFRAFSTKNGPFNNLPLEYRPPEDRKVIPPVERLTWHKITEEDGLPETETGLWLTNFPEIFFSFGPTCFAKKNPPYVPSPHGWFASWTLDRGFSPCGFFSSSMETMTVNSSRIYRQKLLQWILPMRKDWWIPVEKRKETINFLKNVWENRPKDRNATKGSVEFVSWALLKAKEKKRVRELHSQWSKARQAGGPSEESESMPEADGKQM